MLFHVKATHSEDNCPMFRHELMPDMLKAMIDSDDHSAEDGVNVRSAVVDTPAHAIYALVKADSVLTASPDGIGGWTPADIILVRLLYQANVRPSMSAAELNALGL